MTSEEGLETVFEKLTGVAFTGGAFLYENYLIMMAQALRVKGWDGELVFVDTEGHQRRHTFSWSGNVTPDRVIS